MIHALSLESGTLIEAEIIKLSYSGSNRKENCNNNNFYILRFKNNIEYVMQHLRDSMNVWY